MLGRCGGRFTLPEVFHTRTVSLCASALWGIAITGVVLLLPLPGFDRILTGMPASETILLRSISTYFSAEKTQQKYVVAVATIVAQ